MLHGIQENGTPIVNNPKGIEAAADKYRTLSLLKMKRIPIPHSIVTENIGEASKFSTVLGNDILVKPVFGSRGIGISRIRDLDLAHRIFRTLRFHKHVLLLQKFIPHNNKDIRAFVIGNRVVAAMERKADTWRTNISQGAHARPLKISKDLEDLALRSAAALNCEIAGVDLLESGDGAKVLEVNSQPGWRGLQSVSHVEIAEYMILTAKS